MNRLLTLLSCFILFVSCNSKHSKNDLDKMGLKGDVILVQPEHSNLTDKIIEFDNNGNKIRTIMFLEGEQQTLMEQIRFVYDSTNKLQREETSTFSNKNTNNYGTFVKNYIYEKDKIINANDENALVYIKGTYKYNNDLLSEISTEYIDKEKQSESTINKEHYFYNNNNNLDSIVETHYSENGEVFTRKSEIFDKNKLKIKSTDYLKMDGEVYLSNNEYEYNEYNDIIRDTFKNPIKNTSSITKYEYTYDANKNWIEKKAIDEKGEVKVEKRTIIYKNQNFSDLLNKFELFMVQYKPHNQENSNNVSNNNSNYSNNSNTQSASSGNSNTQERRKCNSCNGTGKCSKCMKAFRVHYWAGKGPGWKDENETRPGKIMCDDCHGAGVIYGRHPYGEDPEYKKCYVSACNNGWKNCPECNYNGNSNNLGQCQKCKGSGFDR